MLNDKDTPPIFTSPKLREECPPIKPVKHWVHGWMVESMMYGCIITTMKRHHKAVTTTAQPYHSDKVDEDGIRSYYVDWDAPRIEVNRLKAGTRATRSRVQGAHMIGLTNFMAIHRQYIVEQSELDAFKAFDEAPDPTDHHAHEPRDADAWGESTGFQPI